MRGTASVGGRPLALRVPALALALLALVAIACSVVWMALHDGDGASAAQVGERVRADRYQAVFLDDDRVYFGKLRVRDGQWFELDDAHYIRERADKSTGSSQQVAPVGEEVQQPDSPLLINPSHVVLVENLQKDSRVAAAIESLER